jgi:membrane peptidoglycan carboxypeptidase
MRKRQISRLLIAAACAGVLLAALLLPLLLVPGMALDWVSRQVSHAPVSAIDEPPVGNTRVLAADGSLITEFYERNRTLVTSDQIAPVMKQAIIDIEDARFYEHGAIDVRGTIRALVADLSAGGNVQGGSTLTQQLVKQTLLQQATTPSEQKAAVAETIDRKLTEARLAVRLEGVLPKEQILTRYLNTVYFGAGSYGVQAAAQTFFATDAAHLSLNQAATLAGLVQNPSALDPADHPQAAQRRRDEVLARMHDLHHISDADFAAAKAQPVTTKPGGDPPHGCSGAAIGGFFCAYLQDYLTNTLHISRQQLDAGGLTIRTTLRADIQQAGDRAVVQTLPITDPRAGIYTVVEPGTGRVLGMSVSRQYGCDGPTCTSVDLNVNAAAGSGSTYKVFTAADALQHGFAMDFTQTTSDPYVSRVYKKNGGTVGPPYAVQNVGHYPPTLNMAEALVRSSNTYFVALEDQLGSIEGPVRTAQRMGLFSLTDKTAKDFIGGNFGSFTLGPIATSPLALASAYATVFSGGTQCDPTPVTAILTADGTPLTGPNGKRLDTGTHCRKDALPAGVANTLAQVLRGDVESTIGTGQRANIPGHQIAGKTGTSQNNFSVAFVGSTPEYTASVMVENPDTAQDVGGFGGDKGAQIWHDAMQPILAAHPTGAFAPADPQYLGGLAHRTGDACTFQVANLTAPCS